MTICYVFKSPPTRIVYSELIRFGCIWATESLLVVRDPDSDPGHSITDILSALSPFVKGSCRAREWPGTRLLDDDAMVYRYRTSPELARALTSIRSALFDWLHPEAPEDLCFIRSDGRPIVVTISHEPDAYLLLDEDEQIELEASFPELAGAITVEGPE